MLKPAAPAALVGRGGLLLIAFQTMTSSGFFSVFQSFLVEYLAIKHLALTSLISLSSLFAKVE